MRGEAAQAGLKTVLTLGLGDGGFPFSSAVQMKRISVFLREEALQREVALADPRDIPHSRAWRRREFHTLEPGECKGRLHWQILETFLTLGPGGRGFPFSSGRRQCRGKLHWQVLETFLTLGLGGEGFPFSPERKQCKGRLHWQIREKFFTLGESSTL